MAEQLAASETTAQEVALSVVLPAYNEDANLRELVPEVIGACARGDHHPFEVVIVDDGSTDATATVAREAARRYEQVRFIELQSNYGQSAALAAGFRQAAGAVIVAMDADGQNDPADIPRLLDRYDAGADCVSGWRRERNDPLGKRIPSAIQTRLAKLTGPDINDFGCTLTAYDADALADLDLRGERHRYIPAQLHHRGYEVDEIVVNHRERQHGSSHYGVGRLVRGTVDLTYQWFRVRYRARPMHFFGAVGILAFTLGITLGLWLVGLKYLGGATLGNHLPKLLLSITLGFMGFGLFALGLITELLTELIYRNELPYRIAEVVG